MKVNKKDLSSSIRFIIYHPPPTISFDHNNTYITKYIYRKSEKPLKLNRVFRVKVTKRAKRWLWIKWAGQDVKTRPKDWKAFEYPFYLFGMYSVLRNGEGGGEGTVAARPSFKSGDGKCPSSTPPRPLSSFFTFFRVAEWRKWGKRVSRGLRENALCPAFLTGRHSIVSSRGLLSRVKDHPCARVTDAKGSHDGG